MLRRFLQRAILALFLFPWLCSSSSSSAIKYCPAICTCFLDGKGRKVVSCTQGGLETVPFAEMDTSVEVMKISAPEYNLNTLIMSAAIQDFRNLEELHITRSNVPELGFHLFWTLKKLVVLNLSQNNITQPLDESFRGLHNLKELYLDDNRIISLHSGTFRYLSSLKILSLQRNRIQQMMPRMFENVGKLQVLKLNGNYLRELNPESFKDVLKDLRVFECRGCSLRRVNTQVYGYLPHLAHLDLGHNEFESLSPEDFVNLTSLIYLGLDGNRISVLREEQFSYAINLKRINLSKNRLYRISREAFLNSPNMIELDLSYNKLDKIEKDILEPIAGTLQRLSISGNHLSIDVIREFLKGAPGLRDLQLADAGIVDLPTDVFPKQLSVLNLSGNLLTFLVAEAIPDTLLDLDLSRNRFRGLSVALLEKIEYVTNIRLEKNPWTCDLCHIIPMLDRVNTTPALGGVECAFPYKFEGKTLATLQAQHLGICTNTYSDSNYYLMEDDRIGIIAASASVLILLVAGCAVLGALCYSRRHAARYYTHEEKRASETEAIYDGGFLGEERELSFKFPMEAEKKISIATIDEEIKKEPIVNGT